MQHVAPLSQEDLLATWKERYACAVVAAGAALGKEIAVCKFTRAAFRTENHKNIFCLQNPVELCPFVLLDNPTFSRSGWSKQ